MSLPTSSDLWDRKKGRIEGLVLSVMDYKDNDGIISLATDREVVSIYARGIQKSGSKNRRLFAPYSRVSLNYDPKYSSSMLYQINGNVLANYYRCAQSLEMQCVSELLVSLIRRHGVNPELFEALERFWKAVQDQDENLAMLYACWIVAEILRLTGTLMNVDECVVCGRTNQIASVGKEEGGFLCLQHMGSHPYWPKEKLLALRRIAKVPFSHIDRLASMHWSMDLLIDLFDWYEYYNDIHLKSLDFLKSLCKNAQQSK